MQLINGLFLITAVLMVLTGRGQTYNDPDQQYDVDSLKTAFSLAKTDSLKLEILKHIGQRFRNMANLDSSICYYQKALELVQNGDFPPVYQLWQLTTLQHLTVI